mmetsp:Transcript_9399/g.16085  ORF Transcript_9399/g.16085 Transcript_9399/m.16085 type:complete len:86 (+) Transcript_9399:2105-2362(+)
MLPVVPSIVPNSIQEIGLASSPLRVSMRYAPKPIKDPPSILHPKPVRLQPPFVPRGTFCSVVIRIGSLLDNMPSSDDSVSARLVA